MSDFNPDLAAQNDVESTLPKLNFGKGTLRTSRFIRWDDHPTEKNAKGKPKRVAVVVSEDEFKNLPNGSRTHEVYVGIDIQEFNPALDFQYERKMNIGDLDWNGVFKASLYQALGLAAKQDKEEEKAQLSHALKIYMSSYWATEDVLQTPTERTPNPKYNTVKVVKKFSSREECYSDWQATYKSGTNGSGTGAPQAGAIAAPPGFTGPGEWTRDTQVGIVGVYKGAAEDAAAKAKDALEKALASGNSKVIERAKANAEPAKIHQLAVDSTINVQYMDISVIEDDERAKWTTCIEALLKRDGVAFGADTDPSNIPF